MMGYYSDINELPKIDPKKWNAFLADVKKLKEILPEQHVLRDYLEHMRLDNKNKEIEEIYGNNGKFYHINGLAVFLAKFAFPSLFTFIGEDNAHWGFEYVKNPKKNTCDVYVLEYPGPKPKRSTKLDYHPEKYLSHNISPDNY